MRLWGKQVPPRANSLAATRRAGASPPGIARALYVTAIGRRIVILRAILAGQTFARWRKDPAYASPFAELATSGRAVPAYSISIQVGAWSLAFSRPR